MSDWRTDEPPTDRDIEFETDERVRAVGRIKAYTVDDDYDFKGRRTGKEVQLFINDGVKGLFEVVRWRDLPAD